MAVLWLAALALVTGCGSIAPTSDLAGDAAGSRARPGRSGTTAPSGDPSEDAEIQEVLDRVASAFAAADPRALAPHLRDPEDAFGRAWRDRARHLAEVPLSHYRLVLDAALPDLATGSVRARFGSTAQVRYVREELQLEGFDAEGPAAHDLFLTLVREDGAWRVSGDRDAERLGLVSVDHLWDHGPVVTTRDGDLMALHHPETSTATIATILDQTRRALADVEASWPLPWSGRVPIVVPRDEEELGELLHVTFGLEDFIAFATATSSGELGRYELTGSRILLNTPRFLQRDDATRQRILAHELLHVATRPHGGPMVPTWVDEGVAQVLGERTSTTGTALLAAAVRDGTAEPPADADFTNGGPDRIFLSYQLAWSLADHLADEHGPEALAAFYRELGAGAIGEPGEEAYHVDRAARAVFGTSFATLLAGWLGALRGG